MTLVVSGALLVLVFFAVASFFMRQGSQRLDGWFGGERGNQESQDIACTGCLSLGKGRDIAAGTFSGKVTRVSDTDIVVETDGVAPRTIMVNPDTKVSQERCQKLSSEEEGKMRQAAVDGVVTTEFCERVGATRGNIAVGQMVAIVLKQESDQSSTAYEIIILAAE